MKTSLIMRFGLLLLALVSVAGITVGQPTDSGPPKEEAKSAEAAAEATPPATEPAAEKAAEPPAPVLPPYFSGANPKDEKGNEVKKWPDPTGAAAGTWATPAGDGKGDIPANVTPADVLDRVNHNMYSINMVWVLIAGALVMFMQTGFAMVETGLGRAKNSAHTAAMNFMVYPIGCLAFYIYGFGLGWGNWFNAPVWPAWYSSIGPGTSVLNSSFTVGDGWSLFGTKGFCLAGMDDVSVMALFFFMMVFMDTTATIPTGSMCERWSWKSFCLFAFWVALPYCLYAHWVWGGGWLAQTGTKLGLGHGAVDFAGSGVVHAMGGVIALVGSYCIGPRIGKYIDGKPQAMPAHHIPMVIFGSFILAFGWFGFNAGSTLAGTDLRISTVVVNTMLASIAGAIMAMFTLWAKGLKTDPSMLCNGMLAGLVAITAPCAFVDSHIALLIGAVAGVLVVMGVFFWDWIGIDDPVGAISVHGINGLWGVLSLGLFANGKYGSGWNGVVRDEFVTKFGADNVTGLFYGDSSQFLAQLLSAGTVIVFGGSMAYVWFKVSNLIVPLRVSADVEKQGLDVPEMGAHGYPEFQSHD